MKCLSRLYVYAIYSFFSFPFIYLTHLFLRRKKHVTRTMERYNINTSLTHYKTDRINFYAFHLHQMRRFHLSPRYYFSTSISAYERYT